VTRPTGEGREATSHARPAELATRVPVEMVLRHVACQNGHMPDVSKAIVTREKRMQSLLGGPKLFPLRFASPLRREEWALRVLALEALSKNLRATRAELLAALHVSDRTLLRWKKGAISSEATDRALRIARVAVRAEEVFGNRKQAVDWLHTANRSLAGRKPFDLIRTDAGAELVVDVLGRLEHGVFG